MTFSLPLPSLLLKLPNTELKRATFLSHRRQLGVTFFSYLTCLLTTVFLLLSIFSLIEAISLKIERDHCPGMENVHFRFRPWLKNDAFRGEGEVGGMKNEGVHHENL